MTPPDSMAYRAESSEADMIPYNDVNHTYEHVSMAPSDRIMFVFSKNKHQSHESFKKNVITIFSYLTCYF